MAIESSTPPSVPVRNLQEFAAEVANAIIEGLRRTDLDDNRQQPATSPRALLSTSLFSELRYALGSNDTVNGKATQILPFTVSEVNTRTGRGKISYRPSAVRAKGGRALLITYLSGARQTENIPTSGSDERTIDLIDPHAVAVTIWNDVFTDEDSSRNDGQPILVSFVTYQ
ncbi:hypothetical protein [Millisia brevis]|uniref:hypothetical protein n=1 Tax=Millisia brevis TaxID=264148 RepID=UPI00082E0913|nr:hypothetical protein [Millisia brevis]